MSKKKNIKKKIKLIAISQGIEYLRHRKEYRNYIDQNIINFVESCNFKTILINNFLNKVNFSYQKKKLDIFLNNFKLHGIILSGGNNIGDFDQRDITEKYLISYAIKKSIPLLGICRGMQLINIFFGGSLKRIDNHVKKFNKIKYNNSKKIIKCFHNFGILSLGKKIKATGESEDNQIESLKHQKYEVYGWMWHPERNRKYFNYFKSEIKKIFKN